MRISGLLALCLMLSACAVPHTVSQNKTIKNIAVISALDERLSLSYVGITVFNNTHEVVALDWSINERGNGILKRLLQKKYGIVPYGIDINELKGAHSESEQMAGTFKE